MGTPDQVFDWSRPFYDGIGGFGQILMMGRRTALCLETGANTRRVAA
jgi:hypothetical protein